VPSIKSWIGYSPERLYRQRNELWPELLSYTGLVHSGSSRTLEWD
jgi:hypothetical protein